MILWTIYAVSALIFAIGATKMIYAEVRDFGAEVCDLFGYLLFYIIAFVPLINTFIVCMVAWGELEDRYDNIDWSWFKKFCKKEVIKPFKKPQEEK